MRWHASNCDDSDVERGPGTEKEDSWVTVSAGEDHICGLMSTGNVECWGSDRSGQSTPPGGDFETVSAGRYHTCSLTSTGSVKCWGRDHVGQATPPEL